MRGTKRALCLAVSVAIVAAAPAASGAAAGHKADRRGFQTSAPPQLVAIGAGVTVQPIITAGDIVGGAKHGYQMTGTPDGLGAYRSSGSTVEVFMNHEIALADQGASDARVSHLTLNNAGQVTAGSYPVDGSEGLVEFCSSSLYTLNGGTPWYFTGEEAPTSPHNGTSIALNTVSGKHVEMPWMGHLFHENVVPVGGMSKAGMFVSEDADAGKSQIYTYFSNSFRGAIHGNGKLSVWVPNGGTDAHPSPNDIHKGDTLRGHFVTIPHAGSLGPAALNRASDAVGSFDAVRIEDATADPANPGVVYFADTGSAGQQTFKGRIYKLTMDPASPGKAKLQVILDADAGDDMVQPDNLGISDQALVIQEDRNYTVSGYNRVLVYDLSSGTLTTAARADPTPRAIQKAGLGAWETSGVVDASVLFGSGYWLLDVQAHGTHADQPGPNLKPNTARADGGQLDLVYIPGT